MTRELLILRHGKSDWDAGTDDFNRPLTDRGKRGAQRIATWLMQHDLVPDYVISSPAERAVETARKTCKAMGLGGDDVHTDRAVYLATQQELLDVLARCPSDARRIMLVGHNPGLEDLLEYLSSTSISIPEDGKLLPTAALARLEIPETWQDLAAQCAKLKDLVRPANLPNKFPFPAPHGKESRERPAYYYSQSSVIPFRKSKNGIEILVISSSKKKHFVVPKGIHDPGMSAEASAAQEAREEAGVEGEVLSKRLGKYVYDKWGAACTVTVYPMRVSHVIPEAEWREHHRGREWVSPKEAKARLKQRALVPLVDELVKRYG